MRHLPRRQGEDAVPECDERICECLLYLVDSATIQFKSNQAEKHRSIMAFF
jgi:hypothetical protein